MLRLARKYVRHITLFLSALLVLCGTGSCILKRDYGSDPETEDGKALFVLHIAPVSTRAATDGVAEKIKSLRIIAVGKDENGKNGVIEINRKVTFGGAAASGFGYALTWWTRPGKKDFYIFANEESVKNIQFTDNQRPDGLGNNAATLTALLDGYPATPAGTQNGELTGRLTGSGTQATDPSDNTVSGDDNATDQARAEEFKEVINAVYFAPNYEIEEADGQRTVYLPYSTVYEDVDVTAKKDDGAESGAGQTAAGDSYRMYLVPVATKFYFRFYNYHKNAVKIQKLTIKETDSENFLLGQVAEEEKTKPFNSHPDDPEKNERYYWVDWLEKVAEETRKNLTTDNSNINDQYGWISAYSMPETSVSKAQVLIGVDDDTDLVGGRERKDEETIPAGGPLDDVAGVLYLGPYYFPESRCMVTYKATDEDNKEITITEQQYKLGLMLHDMEVDSATSHDFNEELVIENVRSLFRDTCVLIQISMRKGDVDVYAEMASWEHKEVGGWAEGGSIIP